MLWHGTDGPSRKLAAVDQAPARRPSSPEGEADDASHCGAETNAPARSALGDERNPPTPPPSLHPRNLSLQHLTCPTHANLNGPCNGSARKARDTVIPLLHHSTSTLSDHLQTTSARPQAILHLTSIWHSCPWEAVPYTTPTILPAASSSDHFALQKELHDWETRRETEVALSHPPPCTGSLRRLSGHTSYYPLPRLPHPSPSLCHYIRRPTHPTRRTVHCRSVFMPTIVHPSSRPHRHLTTVARPGDPATP